jgi:hypothetical protein
VKFSVRLRKPIAFLGLMFVVASCVKANPARKVKQERVLLSQFVPPAEWKELGWEKSQDEMGWSTLRVFSAHDEMAWDRLVRRVFTSGPEDPFGEFGSEISKFPSGYRFHTLIEECEVWLAKTPSPTGDTRDLTFSVGAGERIRLAILARCPRN